jgi:coenzyme PQQ synthesis protein D (PqqD)
MGWLIQNPEVVATELEDGAVLLNMDTRTYYSLNEVGLAIWRLVERGASDDDVADGLRAAYAADAEQARSAVLRFLELLQAEHLLTSSDAPPATGVGQQTAPARGTATKKPFREPELIKHDEPLHDVPLTPFDPQLPLAE